MFGSTQLIHKRKSAILNLDLPVLHLSPVQPPAHSHVNEFNPSLQVPPLSQGLGVQSSKSDQNVLNK